MDPKLLRAFAAFIATVLIVGFVLMYGYVIWNCWHSVDCSKLQVSSQFIYVATGLAGLVGGAVAMMFNEKLPVTPQSAQNAPANGGQVVSESGPSATLKAAAAVLAPSKDDALRTISALYVIGYFATGLAAIATWVLVDPGVLDLIKNQALVALGLLLAVARSFVTVPPPQT